MEADWEFDVAADAAVIDAHWPGLVDLQRDPEAASRLAEAEHLAGLAGALVQLNSQSSTLWTSKCDVWADQPFDSDELDSPTEAAACSLACYIDLLPSDSSHWSTPDAVGDWCRRMKIELRSQHLRQCRADLVVRAAALSHADFGFGVTAYLIACGSDPAEAAGVLSRVLGVFAETAVALANGSKYNENIAGE
jgi:hypothetical protein